MESLAKSFARGVNARLAECFPHLHGTEELDRESRYVFLDQTHLRSGVLWEPGLGTGLCRSLTMVALGVPMYGHAPQHEFCGREWSGMQQLAQARFAGKLQPIFVVRLRSPLPEPMNAFQYFDLSKSSLRERLPLTPEFNDCLEAIVDHVREVVKVAIASPFTPHDCQSFRLPDSAFESQPRPQLPNQSVV